MASMDGQASLSPAKDPLVSVAPETDFVLYHVHDGKPLASYIKQRFSDKRLQCIVQTREFDSACRSSTRRTDSNLAKVTVLIASPMMLSLLPQMEPFVRDLFPNCEMSVVICVHTEMEKVVNILTGVVDRFEKWTKCLIGENRASFRNCLVTLMTMLDDCDMEPLPAMKLFQVIPSTINSNTEKIHIIFTTEIQGQVDVRYCGHAVSSVLYNPYTVIFSPSASTPVGSADIEVAVNGVGLGTETVSCLSKKDEVCQLLQDVLNPLEFLSESLFPESVGSRPELDGFLAAVMEREVHAKLIDAFRRVENVKCDDYTSHQEQPTLLHFAAKLGLRKVTRVILKLPGAVRACRMLNSVGWSAEGVARIAGHGGLADDIRIFKEQHCNDRRPPADPCETYVDMKRPTNVPRTWSNPERLTSPPVPTTPRPKTDPKYVRNAVTASSDICHEKLNKERNVMRRQRSEGSTSIHRDAKVIESKCLMRQKSNGEKSRSNRVTVLIEDSMDLDSLSNTNATSGRAEREYATIGEIIEDLKTYTSLTTNTQPASPPLPEKQPVTFISAINNQLVIQERKTEPQENLYSTPKPVS